METKQRFEHKTYFEMRVTLYWLMLLVVRKFAQMKRFFGFGAAGWFLPELAARQAAISWRDPHVHGIV